MAKAKRTAAAVLALGIALAVPATPAQELSSGRDYSDNAQRDKPIACKQGDIVAFPGMTMGELFAEQWPAQPEPSSPASRAGVDAFQAPAKHWPPGLEGQQAITVMAILVDAAGDPLRAEVICSTRTGFDASARRMAMSVHYRPARIDGRAITSVAVQVYRFVPQRRRVNKPATSGDS